MSRRALTFVLGCLLAFGFALAGAVQTVPYVLLSPGPAFDTLGAVQGVQVLGIKGAKTYPTDGTLDMTTVSVRDHLSLFEALQGWLDGSEAVVPREFVIPPGQSQKQSDQQNARDMTQSQDDATAAAMRELGIKGRAEVSVGAVDPKGGSAGLLKPGDVLTSIDGAPVVDADGLFRLISRHTVGDSLVVGYLRDGVAGRVTVVTHAASDDPTRPRMGINPSVTYHFPISVTIQLKDVGGPSAGLMFALGILDKLQPGSLTGGLHIAGTGEISPDGTVGEIGGIAQKMRGARAVGATVFLVPAANCPEARDTKPAGLQLVKVSTLHGAVAALATLRGGGTPPTC